MCCHGMFKVCGVVCLPCWWKDRKVGSVCSVPASICEKCWSHLRSMSIGLVRRMLSVVLRPVAALRKDLVFFERAGLALNCLRVS